MLEQPYLCDMFDGGLVEHLSPYLRVRLITCTVVVPGLNRAPAKTHYVSLSVL